MQICNVIKGCLESAMQIEDPLQQFVTRNKTALLWASTQEKSQQANLQTINGTAQLKVHVVLFIWEKYLLGLEFLYGHDIVCFVVQILATNRQTKYNQKHTNRHIIHLSSGLDIYLEVKYILPNINKHCTLHVHHGLRLSTCLKVSLILNKQVNKQTDK